MPTLVHMLAFNSYQKFAHKFVYISGEEALIYALNQGNIEYIVVNQANLKLLVKVAEKVPSLKTAIIVDQAQADQADLNNVKERKITIYSFEEIEALGAAKPLPPTPPKPEDIASIQYTSVCINYPILSMRSQTHPLLTFYLGIHWRS